MATVPVANKRHHPSVAVETLLASSAPAWARLSAQATATLAAHSIGLLRISLGMVFIWFGVLKVIGLSPAAALVRATLPWMPPQVVVPALGWFEVALGLTLVAGVGLRLAVPLFCAHLAGTFLVLVMEPRVAFQGSNPLLLTMTGEFVVKNVVLIAAGLAVAGATCAPARATLALSGDRAP